MRKVVERLLDCYTIGARRIHVSALLFAARNLNTILFVAGSAMLISGLASIDPAFAQVRADYEIIRGLCRVMTFTEGSFGATVMAVAGLIAVVSAAMGGYRAALSAIVVGIGAWIIRPVVELFFGYYGCEIGEIEPNLPG